MLPVDDVLWNARWQLPFWLKATALKTQELSWGLSKEISKVEVYMQSAANQVLHSVTVWSRWWCVTEKFLRQIFCNKLRGVTGNYLKKIVDRTDLRSIRLRKDWSQRSSGLREIKARGMC